MKTDFDLDAALISLLRIESITNNEKAIADFTYTEIQRLHPDLEPERIGNNLIVRIKGGPDGTLGLFGHLDTVPGQEFGNLVKSDAENIYGLGASDMKGGLAVMLGLIYETTRRSPKFDLTFVFYASEEGPYATNALHQLMSDCPDLKQVDLAFMLEPTDGALHLGCMGISNATVTFNGKRAHAARPWLGDNAIHKAGPFLARLHSTPPRLAKYGKLEFKEVYTATKAQAGIAVNVVPDKFELNVNIRFAPGENISSAQERFKQIVASEAEVSFWGDHPSGPVPLDNRWLSEFQSKFNLDECPKQAYTDVGLLALHGVPAINFGPGLTAQAHQKNEYIKKTDLKRNFEIFREYLFL